MDSVVLAARLVLAGVFVVAAVGKLLDLPSSRRSLIGFGVPEPLANVLGTVLPFAELAVAIALIPEPSAQWGALGALVLLLAFAAGIGNALRKGEAPDCNCFGAIHSEPASAKMLVRNLVLAAVALVAVIWGPGPAITTWVSDRTAAELVAVLIGIALIALLTIGIPVWRENRKLRSDLARARERLDKLPPGLPIGSLAPEFSVPDGEDGTLTLASLLEKGRPVVLVFAAAGCGPCEAMLPMFSRLQSIAADRVTIGVVGINTFLRYDAVRQAHGGERMLADAVEEDPVLKQEIDDLIEIFHSYDVHHSPAAVLVTPGGTIGSGLVDARRGIEALIRVAIADATRVSGPPEAISAA
jgi:thiol-disulfide isomerase/thioredoxin/uncharacterized membrane protein YphA (DoxX/SURF4 family)